MRDKAIGESPTRVNRQRFVQFVKHFMKDISESHATDMFMHVLKKLHQILQAIMSPNQSRIEEPSALMESRDNKDLATATSPQLKSQYQGISN